MSGNSVPASDLPSDDEALLPLVYDELRRLAASQLANERANHTLSPTALVHEAYLRLLGPEGAAPEWNSRGHFFSAAAQAMRRILVDNARQRHAEKRGGPDARRVPLELTEIVDESEPTDLLDLDAALEQLEQHDPQLAQLVNLRYFAGLTIDQIAELQGNSVRSTERNWTYARAWLRQSILAEHS